MDGEKPLTLARDAFCSAELALDLPFETDGEYAGRFGGRASPGVEMSYHSMRGMSVMRNSFSTGDLHSLALSSHVGSTRELLLDEAAAGTGPYKKEQVKDEHARHVPASYQNTGSGGGPTTASGVALDRIDEVDDNQGHDRSTMKAMPADPPGAASQWRQETEDARRKELIQQEDAVQQMLRHQQQHEQQRSADGDQSLDNSMNSFDISLAQMEANLLVNANSSAKAGGTGPRGYFGGYLQPQQPQPRPLPPHEAQEYHHRPEFDVHNGGSESVNPLLFGRGAVVLPPQGHYVGAEHDSVQRRLALGNMGAAMPGISGSFGSGGAMRRALSTGDLSQLNGSGGRMDAGRTMETGGLTTAPRRIGKYSIEERQEKIRRYREKKLQRNFKKTIKYTCRKTLADSRPRVHGRFAKHVPSAPGSDDASPSPPTSDPMKSKSASPSEASSPTHP